MIARRTINHTKDRILEDRFCNESLIKFESCRNAYLRDLEKLREFYAPMLKRYLKDFQNSIPVN